MSRALEMSNYEGALTETANALAPMTPVHRIVTRLLVALGLAVVLALAFVPWQQSAVGQGRVVAFAPTDRSQSIDAPVEGRVVHWRVREGATVRAGDVLVEISDNDPAILERLRQERSSVEARREAAKSRADSLAARAEALRGSRERGLSAAAERVKMARERLRAAEEAEKAATASVATARANAVRQTGLSDKGLASTRALELAELDYTRAKTDEARARAAVAAARSEESALAADRFKLETDGDAAIEDARASRAAALVEVANADAELSRIDVRLARQSTQTVKAPRDGTIVRVVATGQGVDVVKAGDPLAVFIPDTSDRAVELWVDGNDVPLIEEGRHVRLQFEGWPAVQWRGWPSVAVGTFGGLVKFVDQHDDGKGRFRVVVVPEDPEAWPSARFLRQGVRASGWVLLERVRLGYELWRQFNGFPPLLSMDEPAVTKEVKK